MNRKRLLERGIRYLMDRAQMVHNAIKEYYLNLGNTEEQWQVVSKNPAKFNLVWRRALNLKGGGVPPENLRNLNAAYWRHIEMSFDEIMAGVWERDTCEFMHDNEPAAKEKNNSVKTNKESEK